MYDAAETIPELASFDLVYSTWGTIVWLPDIGRWAEIVAYFLKPGGSLYLADGHPFAYVFDSAKRTPEGLPGYFTPYFQTEPVVIDDPHDYASEALLRNALSYEWMHPLSEITGGLLAAGLTLRWLHEHAATEWKMFNQLSQGPDRLYRWPDKPWLPLAFSLKAERGAFAPIADDRMADH